MDFHQLKTLQKLDREKSFSRTSKELGISQPTVTTRIKMLEKELDENLVLRTGQKAILTDAGKRFLTYIDRALQVFQFGVDRLANNEQNISIAATPTINTFILPRKIKEARKKEPNVKLKFITGSSNEIIQMVKDELVDIGLIRGSAEDHEIETFQLFEEELHLVHSRQHPFQHLKNITVHDLTSENIIVYRRLSGTYKLIKEAFRKEGARLNVSMELEHVITVKQMVLAGMGLAFLPESAIKKEMANGELVKKNLINTKIIREVSLIYKRENHSVISSNIFKMLRDIFKEA
ncbi:LysR family transcriptional regulator [Halalkalibacterium ligniniphilum]|uniref:LysR family transcriptional regulator n=1 Tax=Halalkalibacterium ligniniphilum TaxID=1134413 RepID=UPI00034573BF|nr:LysR family transcriptional regulator [Halalkalibacterium ligniniphilum]